MVGFTVEDSLNMAGVALLLFILVYVLIRLLTHRH
jgi:hypothetical protein